MGPTIGISGKFGDKLTENERLLTRTPQTRDPEHTEERSPSSQRGGCAPSPSSIAPRIGVVHYGERSTAGYTAARRLKAQCSPVLRHDPLREAAQHTRVQKLEGRESGTASFPLTYALQGGRRHSLKR